MVIVGRYPIVPARDARPPITVGYPLPLGIRYTPRTALPADRTFVSTPRTTSLHTDGEEHTVASSRNRQRALARAKLERQMARRAAAARKRRQRLAISGIVIAVVVVLGGGGAIAWAAIGGKDNGKSKSNNSKSSALYSDSCYKEQKKGSNTNLKDVGVPKASNAPDTGTASMTITTNRGTIGVKLDPTKAPCNVYSFDYLASKKFFDNTTCHRLTLKASGLEVLQCGDPSGTGQGGPTYTVKDENLPKGKKITYPAGTVAVANTGQSHTGSSQFFIVYGNSKLPASYSVIGTVTKGLGVVKKVAKAGVKSTASPSASASPSPASDGTPKESVTIKTLRVTETPASPSPSASASASASATSSGKS
jgi:peptidyl-prolyl cis-trans isomerase B (cyclophilin B)